MTSGCRLGSAIWFLLAVLGARPAPAAINIRLDFDDDNDPTTVRTALPAGQATATVRFILEVASLPLPGDPFWLQVEEGCCEAPIWQAHYGTSVVVESITFDPVYVAAFSLGFPVCTYCCPWIIETTLSGAAPVVAGGRYFIGQATWNADCHSEAACTPPTLFILTGDGIGGSGPMTFGCPVVPVQAGAWGALKATWR